MRERSVRVSHLQRIRHEAIVRAKLVQILSHHIVLQRERSEVRMQKLRNWLCPSGWEPRHMLQVHHSIYRKCHPETCTWFLPELSNWINSPSRTTMWIQGSPGCGKSVLSAFTVERLLRQVPVGSAHITFFYCGKYHLKLRSFSWLRITVQLVATLAECLTQRLSNAFFCNFWSAAAITQTF
jgi:hypothetical protein